MPFQREVVQPQNKKETAMPRRFLFRQGKDYFEGIPTVAEWQRLTTIKTLGFTHSRKNPHILDIDQALENFDQSESAPFDRGRETAEAIKTRDRITALLLLAIAKKCAFWLESKAGSDKSRRRKLVANLLMETQKALASLNLKLDEGPASRRAGKQSEFFASMAARLRWTMAREAIKHLGAGKGLKMLDPDYWAETNIGGANPQHIQGKTMNEGWQAQKGKAKDKFMFNYARRRAQEVGTDASVKYVNEAERWRYQILFDFQGKMYRRKSPNSTTTSMDALIDTGGGAWIFVIDKQGNCYTSFGENPGDGKKFHHSTILSGVAVLCAGAIVVEKGMLKEIDNASGHYKPAKEHLLNALRELQKKRVNLNGVRVLYLAGMRQLDGTDVPMFEIYNDARKFLQTGGNIPPDQKT